MLVVLIISAGCNREETLFEVSFLVVNKTDGNLLIEYDYLPLERDCGFNVGDCERREIADVTGSGNELELLINDEVEPEFDIQTLFRRFRLYKNLEPSNFVFWDSSFLTETRVGSRIEYTLNVDESFF